MILCWFATGEDHIELAKVSANVAKHVSPNLHRLLITFDDVQLNEFDEIRKVESGPLMLRRMQEQMRLLKEGKTCLFLDSDIVVNKPINKYDAFVKLAWREPPKGAEGQCYCGGLIYADGHLAVPLYEEMLHMYEDLPEHLHKWWGDQLCLAACAPKYEVDGSIFENWHYVPESKPEKLLDADFVHFKGPRKKWFFDYAKLRLKA